ncbi:MAG: hypothetical protein AAGE84_14220 [Cyanobacteria bacterium P01_G01_bin.39]
MSDTEPIGSKLLRSAGAYAPFKKRSPVAISNVISKSDAARSWGFPHERHRAYRLKAAPQHWRIRAVQEAIATPIPLKHI